MTITDSRGNGDPLRQVPVGLEMLGSGATRKDPIAVDSDERDPNGTRCQPSAGSDARFGRISALAGPTKRRLAVDLCN